MAPKNNHHVLWITDPWSTLDHPKDTSLRLMEESLKTGISTYWADVHDVFLENESVFVNAKALFEIANTPPRPREAATFRFDEIQKLPLSFFSKVVYRTDPPVDLAYIHPLLIMRLCTPVAKPGTKPLKKNVKTIEFINPIEAILGTSEKLETFYIKGHHPPSMVSSQWKELSSFGVREQKTVLKPLNLAQSKGISLIDWQGDSKEAVFELLKRATADFSTPVILQRYFAEIKTKGETRLWFVDGKLIACAQKVPKTGEFKIDMDAGSRLEKATLTAEQKRVVKKIGLQLMLRKIRWAAVDIIGTYITDYNITSPGLIVGMEALLKKNLAKLIIETLKAQ